jgi:hypothetical protein
MRERGVAGVSSLLLNRFLLSTFVHIVVRSQNIVQQPSIPVELGETVQLKEISHNYYVIYHQDARTSAETPSIAAAERQGQIIAHEESAQQEQLKSHYMLEQKYFKERYMLPTKEYRYTIPQDYKLGILLDPCKGKGHGCCDGVYGTPEYRLNNSAGAYDANRVVGDTLVPAIYSMTKDESNRSFGYDVSRRQDDLIVKNDSCISAGNPHVNCIEHPLAAARPHLRSFQQHVAATDYPDCWDHNHTVLSGVNCSSKEGMRVVWRRCVGV